MFKLSLGCMLLAGIAMAGAPVSTEFTYQGQLKRDGRPATGIYDFEFRLFDLAAGGTQQGGTIPKNDVSVENGLFNVPLDFGSVFDGSKRWLDVRVRDGASSGAFTPMTPRQELTATPHANSASRLALPYVDEISFNGPALTITNASSESSAKGIVAYSEGVGGAFVSTSELGVGVGVVGDGRIGVSGLAYYEGGKGVQGQGFAYGGQFFGFSGTGVYGQGTTIGVEGDGIDYGGYFTANSVASRGVFGKGAIIGVEGEGIDYGGYFTAGSASAHGEPGPNISGGTDEIGVFGGAWTLSAYGVYGVAPLGAGVSGRGQIGVRGISESEDGIGVRGQCSNGTDAYGVWGISNQGYGVVGDHGPLALINLDIFSRSGVLGLSANGNGVIGATSAKSAAGVVGVGTDNNYGVFGYNMGGGTAVYGVSNLWAGYFQGNVHVNGVLSKLLGSFKIDHPLDPQNKYLAHSFVESPDMMNIYNGMAVMDAQGEALVELPDYFEALNRDFRYQLTAIGAAAPNLHIAKKISNGQFRIAGGVAGLEVSWQVTGIRQDPVANHYRIQVESAKPEAERGKYLVPEAYGLPKEQAIGYPVLQAQAPLDPSSGRTHTEKRMMQPTSDPIRKDQRGR